MVRKKKVLKITPFYKKKYILMKHKDRKKYRKNKTFRREVLIFPRYVKGFRKILEKSMKSYIFEQLNKNRCVANYIKKRGVVMHIHKLKLHEVTTALNGSLQIVRVPGGWIYTYHRLDEGQMNSVFVPYNQEFFQDQVAEHEG